ncbi:unnamed protein product [Staurois parvus]|uniref:Uncharacterized protein n=1 Tax=Staurois parvus TaxID=386267 RepID=A0ABN9CE57_9NEOB|nr:unnamed protein product [Staurois parvus]
MNACAAMFPRPSILEGWNSNIDGRILVSLVPQLGLHCAMFAKIGSDCEMAMFSIVKDS